MLKLKKTITNTYVSTIETETMYKHNITNMFLEHHILSISILRTIIYLIS